ncbi:MAG: hypothetical protein BWY16_00182 [Candidatus Omnitrophica bacterium ADurb.Bin205]|nr:MAG: hypothetical protein BWY16_00182 [Candidatus Omnitrophica bacterium ADurb.Bin205]
MISEIGMTNSKGFTMIEIMASVLILGVGLTLVINSYLMALKGATYANNSVEALRLGQERMDALEISALKSGLQPQNLQGVIESSFKQYNYNLSVKEIANPEYLAKDLVQACLEIAWQEQNSPKNVIFSAYLPKQKE